ncbi:hypothetical protein [Candidatus Hodarchaeum mangrovi]
MAESSKINFYVGTFLFVIVGFFVRLIVEDILDDIAPTTPILEVFTPFRVDMVFSVIVLFVFLFVIYWGSTLFIDSSEKTGILSLTFLITLIVATLAMLLAYIIHTLLTSSSVTINLDLLLDSFFIVLPLSVAPAIAAVFGYSNKSK